MKRFASVELFGVPLVVCGCGAELQFCVKLRQPTLESLVQEAGDLGVLLDLLVGVEFGLEQVNIPICKLLEGRFHGGCHVGISIFQIALTLMSCLGARRLVDLLAAPSPGCGFPASAGRSSSPGRGASSSASTSLGRAGLLGGRVAHGAIQVVRL